MRVIGKMYQVNNLVIFSGKPIGTEEFLNRMDETLGINIDKRTKRRFRKMEGYIINRMRPYLN